MVDVEDENNIQHLQFLIKDISTYVNLWVEFDQEPLSLEAQFANLGPIEGVYLGVALGEMLKRKEMAFSDMVRARGSRPLNTAGGSAVVT